MIEIMTFSCVYLIIFFLNRIQGAERQEKTDSIDDISVSESTLPPIAESEFCAAQVQKLCPAKRIRKDDYLVYNCLEIAASEGKLVDEQCQHFLWVF